jgi:hypothetical protein
MQAQGARLEPPVTHSSGLAKWIMAYSDLLPSLPPPHAPRPARLSHPELGIGAGKAGACRAPGPGAGAGAGAAELAAGSSSARARESIVHLSSGAVFTFLTCPINNRPLKTSLPYAK